MVVGSGAKQAVSEPRIVGIVLARNEDLFVGRAVGNAAAFCDEWIFCDHGSTDGTADVLEDLESKLTCARLHKISHPRESHELLRPFCAADTWIFGLDGDEIYDPTGLARLRAKIISGEFRNSWMILGNVLHVTSLAVDYSTAAGYLSPPCRSMTKLYNFAAIESWGGNCLERLHGGKPVFREGFSAAARRNLHEEADWDDADFRCLHLCFLPRSSRVAHGAVRRNIMETYGASRRETLINRVKQAFQGNRDSKWKNERYRRGPEVTVDATPFFCPSKSGF